MALKALLTKAAYEALNPALKTEYVQQGDDFVLDVEDRDFKAKLNEFRENNKQLAQEKAALVLAAERFKGVDPEKYQAAVQALDKIDAMEDKDLIKAGNLDALIAKRTGAMQRDYQTQLDGLKKLNEELSGKYGKTRTDYHAMLVNDAVVKALGDVGVVRKGAMPDVMARARQHWSVDETSGELKAKDLYDSKAQPITTMPDFAKHLLVQAPFLFEDAQGGGARGGNREGGAGKTVDWNDANAVGKNLNGILKGDVKVAPPNGVAAGAR